MRHYHLPYCGDAEGVELGDLDHCLLMKDDDDDDDDDNDDDRDDDDNDVHMPEDNGDNL